LNEGQPGQETTIDVLSRPVNVRQKKILKKVSKIMKRKIGIIALLSLIAVCSTGQVNQRAESIKTKLEILRIQAQFKMDSIRLDTECKLHIINSKAQDSLSLISLTGQSEMEALQLEGQQKLEKLSAKAESGIFNGTMRQKHFEKEFNDIENEYSIKILRIEEKYNSALEIIENHYSHIIEKIELDAQMKMTAVENWYKKEFALLETEFRE
jgi:hypothetical protein